MEEGKQSIEEKEVDIGSIFDGDNDTGKITEPARVTGTEDRPAQGKPKRTRTTTRKTTSTINTKSKGKSDNGKSKRDTTNNNGRVGQNVSNVDITELSQKVGMIIDVIFNMLESRMGEHWKLDENEKILLSEPIAKILVKYIPKDVLSNVSDGAALLMVFGGIIIPRIYIQIQINQSKKQGGVKNDIKKGEIYRGDRPVNKGNKYTTNNTNNGKSVFDTVQEQYD